MPDKALDRSFRLQFSTYFNSNLNGFKSNKEIKHLIRMINIKNKIFQQNMSLKKFGLTVIYGRNIIKRKTV